ncbi:unnamed protein product [Phytophthora lilii]|uniref:Unnamed protein product n=1 Tax=Phytophthora lilii TaxID=2077276 RepID=A0A9W6TSQ2_9STRA|nr:unnamed protein product [Phytophthora lilii]
MISNAGVSAARPSRLNWMALRAPAAPGSLGGSGFNRGIKPAKDGNVVEAVEGLDVVFLFCKATPPSTPPAKPSRFLHALPHSARSVVNMVITAETDFKSGLALLGSRTETLGAYNTERGRRTCSRERTVPMEVLCSPALGAREAIPLFGSSHLILVGPTRSNTRVRSCLTGVETSSASSRLGRSLSNLPHQATSISSFQLQTNCCTFQLDIEDCKPEATKAMTDTDETSDQPTRATIEYDNGKTLMAQGPQALHDHVASRMEKALGRALPQMEVRFKDVSISADIVVTDEANVKTELPTLANELMKGIRGLGAKKHTVKKQILKNVSGVFKPGTITLVLGQPGSGKSSLMKLLSGRFPQDKNVTVDGEVTYNGMRASELGNRLPQFVSYVTQRDKHYPSLTVKETLEPHSMPPEPCSNTTRTSSSSSSDSTTARTPSSATP